MDFELDYKAVAISIPFSVLFIGAMWKLKMWTESTMFTWKLRLLISILLPIVLYFVVWWQINK